MAKARAIGAVVGALAAAAVALTIAVDRIEARQRLEARANAITGGHVAAGRAAIARRPCGACHEIPGIRGAEGTVGPPLTRFARRAYIGGRLSNTPDNLAAWIQDPHVFDPQSAMPPMGIGEPEARDIAAYLYTLG
jgi:cytochrome c1